MIDQIQLCRDLHDTELANEIHDADKDVFLKDFRQFWVGRVSRNLGRPQQDAVLPVCFPFLTLSLKVNTLVK